MEKEEFVTLLQSLLRKTNGIDRKLAMMLCKIDDRVDKKYTSETLDEYTSIQRLLLSMTKDIQATLRKMGAND